MKRKRKHHLITTPHYPPETQLTNFSAAKTALLLDNTQLGGSFVAVEAAPTFDDIAPKSTATPTESAKEDAEQQIAQEDKPRSRIVAEYLAHGYALSDTAIQKAIALDQKHGFSNRFTAALSTFDKKYNASDRARGFDESYKLSDRAATGWRGLNHYFEKAMDNPSGRKLRDFYAQTDKQVRDIHNEARRLADLKSSKAQEGETAPGQADAGAQVSGDVPAAAGREAADLAPSTAPTSEPAGAAAPAEPKA